MTATSPVRVLGLLDGDIASQASDARVKYGQLFAALAAHCDLVGVRDVELRGLDRYWNAARTLRRPWHRWREAFRTNRWAFERRSRRAQKLVRAYRDRTDVVFQHGTIFSADLGAEAPPTIVYTDFTYPLVQREDPARDPFGDPRERERWNELEGGVARRAAFVLTRSEYTRRSVIADYGVAPERVAVVGGGVNFERLPEPQSLVPSPRVLFIGKDFERKGGDVLVAAFARVRRRVSDAELWLVTDDDVVASPGIRRIDPIYDRTVITMLYRVSSVFAMPSRCETWGDVFLEAMAHGLPCIGGTNDAMPEIIQHGETGYVVAPNDVAGLAGYLEQLLRDPALRSRMGARGRERVATMFTWDHVVRRMLPYLQRAWAPVVVERREPALGGADTCGNSLQRGGW